MALGTKWNLWQLALGILRRHPKVPKWIRDLLEGSAAVGLHPDERHTPTWQDKDPRF